MPYEGCILVTKNVLTILGMQLSLTYVDVIKLVGMPLFPCELTEVHILRSK